MIPTRIVTDGIQFKVQRQLGGWILFWKWNSWFDCEKSGTVKFDTLEEAQEYKREVDEYNSKHHEWRPVE